MSSPLVAELMLALPRGDTVLSCVPAKARPPAEQSLWLSTLHFTSVRLLSETKTRVHSRIVVVGASTAGLAFLYTLLSIPHLHFSNLLLVSRDGI